MELDEFLEVSTLLDYYKNLLSDKQREYLINHFEDDLSLSEIAKNNDVSRQAVYDNIKRGIKLLKDYEEKLGFHEREKQVYQELLELKKDFKIEKLNNIIEKLF
ncbi:YlxM family DNA-binding protein [Fusobacterium sp.]|uniref:YlxM family DNA-binding protein n=1 Tax=Fusobacterium sp. TaxID=68766 RepID=UPI002902A13D|nr:sigma factor-like helix-turn-helix DNA-binding protein [Fusobacterium sp.]MDU1909734.1 sigma factor-like helix-turn-helix DNA-binding protein [Fusobacterium sp.]